MKIDQVEKVVIIGAGIMGVGIAQNLAQAGFSVNLVDMKQSILDSALAQIKANLKLFNEFKLLEEDHQQILSRIRTLPAQSLKQIIGDGDYIVEAVPELLEAKKEILADLEKHSSKAIIASNTSSFTIDELTGEMNFPERVVGVHYFNPAHIIPVVEIHRGQKTSEETLQIARELMMKAGKIPVMVKKTLPGFIVNRLTGALEREIDYLLDEGVVTPEDLDSAIKGSIGFRMACLGPQETEDMIGLDTSMLVSARVFPGLSNATGPSSQLTAKVKAGDLGIKAGRGWYDYTGKSREQALEENNRKLLSQLAVFKSRKETGTDKV
jgi:3-hydroxybutyryl-CoA dehydrogenase